MKDARNIYHIAYLAPHLGKEGAYKVSMSMKVEQTLKKAKNH